MQNHHHERRYMNFPRTSPRPKKMMAFVSSRFDDDNHAETTVENQFIVSGVPVKDISQSGRYADVRQDDHDHSSSLEESRQDDNKMVDNHHHHMCEFLDKELPPSSGGDVGGDSSSTNRSSAPSDDDDSLDESDGMTWTFGSLSGLYHGPFLDGDEVPHGRGVIFFRNGDTYEGPVTHGEMHGSDGILTKSDGSCYKGQFRHNRCHGIAEYTTLCRRYVGQFEHGIPHGEGTQFYMDGSVDFEGNWESGEPALDIDNNTEELRMIFEEVLDRDEWEEGFDLATSCRASRQTIINQLSRSYVSLSSEEDGSYVGHYVEQVPSY